MASEYYRLVERGIRETQGQFGLSFVWRNLPLPCLRESSAFFDKLMSGGFSEQMSPTITVLRSDLTRIAPGQMFTQEEDVRIDRHILLIDTITDDVEEPSIILTLKGLTQ